MAAIFHFFACLAIGVSVTAAADNQTVITIHNAFPRPYNPKTLATSAKKVCYPNLGCFAIGSVDDRFKHHICLPEKPEIINVKTHLNTRQEPMVGTNADILRWRDPETIRKSSFDSTKPTIIVVHGFLAHVDKDWLVELAQVSLKMDDVNFIRVGWHGGAFTPLYPQAVCDTRLVGAEIAKLVEELQILGQDLNRVWLVGHSLGAHIMGFVGRRVLGIGRITGLDPAEPYYENYHVDSRLDPSDANFVDIVHTDSSSVFAGGAGTKEPCGHVDFYPNGGQAQPGCNLGIIESIIGGKEGMKQYVVCNHQRAFKILIEAVRAKAEGRTCQFKAHPCDSYEKYLRGECQNCGAGCTLIGPDALLTRPKTTQTMVKMYLITLGEAPFCGGKLFDLTAKLPAGFVKDRGALSYKVTTHDHKTFEQEVSTSKADNLEPEHTLHRIVTQNKDIDIQNMKELEVKFTHYWSLKDPSTWVGGAIKFESASITPLDEKTGKTIEVERVKFCPDGKKAITLEKDKWAKLYRC